MSVNFNQYHPGALLESISGHTRLASQFQNEVLQDEQSFIDYVSSYGLTDQFVDGNGQLTLKHLPEDAETFLKILENRLKRAGKDFLPEINRLTYNPPRQLSATARTAPSYTDQILGKQASSTSTPKKSATDLVLLKLRDDFFDAVLGAGTNEASLEDILRQLDTPAKQSEFQRLVMDDPRAAQYKGTVRVEDILTQELGGRALGRATAQLSVPDGETLFLSSLNTDTYKNLVEVIKQNHADPQLVLSFSADQIRQTGNPDLVSVTEDLLKDIRTLAAESIRSGVFDFDLSPRDLETKFTLGHLLMLKNTFGNVRFQIEQMQNLAQHMKDAGEGKGFGRSDAPMQKFDAAKKQLEAALAGLSTATTPESAARVMQEIAKASGNMLRESILFKEQEKQGLSQYEANARAGELGAYTVIGAFVTIGTMGIAGAALGGTGAMGLGGLMMTKGSLVTAAGVVAGGTAQTAAHFSFVKFGGSEDMSLTEIAKGAYREQLMTGVGVLTGAQIGRAFMGIEKLQHLHAMAPRLASTLPGRGLVWSATQFQHLQKVAPRVAQALEGAASNMTIGGEHTLTQWEIDPYVVALWALSGVLNRGVLNGIDDAIEGSAQAALARKLAGAASMLGKDISLEAGEEVLETLIAEGYITPDQVIQSAMAALQELGSSESLTKNVAKAMGSGLDIGQQIQEETPPWESEEASVPPLPDTAIQRPPYTHRRLVRHIPPAQFLHGLNKLKRGLKKSDTLILGKRHAHGFPIKQDRPDIADSHAKIIFKNGGWLIQNLDSSHQTFINNELVESPRRVRSGDLIRLGPEMEFVFPAEAEITNTTTFAPPVPENKPAATTARITTISHIDTPQNRSTPNAFVPDAHVMTAHHKVDFQTLAREFGTDINMLNDAFDQNNSMEHGYFRFSDGELVSMSGRANTVNSSILATDDENSPGDVEQLDAVIHTHARESPEPSKEDLTVLIAKARLNPGVEQKQMSLGLVNGEKAAVAVLAEFDPETSTTHLSFLATEYAHESIDQQKLNDLATEVDAELATLSQTQLTLRAHLELGNGESAHTVQIPNSPKSNTVPPPQRFQEKYPNGIVFPAAERKKNDPKFILQNPDDNGFLPGKETLENEFNDPSTIPPKLGLTKLENLEELALKDGNSEALQKLTKIASASSGVRLAPIPGANVHKVVAAYLKQHRDNIYSTPIPNQRVVVDLKSLPQAEGALDPGTLNALAKIHDITIEVHSRTPDGDVNVQEYLSKTLAKKQAEAAKKGITGELKRYQIDPSEIHVPQNRAYQFMTPNDVQSLLTSGPGTQMLLNGHHQILTAEDQALAIYAIQVTENGFIVTALKDTTIQLNHGILATGPALQRGDKSPGIMPNNLNHPLVIKLEGRTPMTLDLQNLKPQKQQNPSSSPNFLTNYLDRFFVNYFSTRTGPIDDVTLTDLQDQLQWVDDDVDVHNMAHDRDPYYKAYRNHEPDPTRLSLSIDEGIQNLNVFNGGDGILAPRPDSIWLDGGSTPNTHDIGRFYFAVRGTHAKAFAETLMGIFKQAQQQGIVFSFKIPNEQQYYSRADAGVLYFDAKNQEWIYKKIIEMVTSHPTWFRDRTPHFTANVLDEQGRPINGLAFAMDPQVRGGSYGGTISSCIARAVRKLKDRATDTRETITKELLYDTILNAFKDSNIDLNAPAFIHETQSGNRGTDVFAFIREHSDQNAGAVPR